MSQMDSQLDSLKEDFRSALGAALSSDGSDGQALQQIRSSYFGPKGKVTLLLRGVGQLPAEERPTAGKRINVVRQELSQELDSAIEKFESVQRKQALEAARLDMSLPGRFAQGLGAVHPVNRIVDEINQVFLRMGFEVATGPEVELDQYNFGALNFPDDHPARDMQDTFFVVPPDKVRKPGDLVLRTHTSPVQIRTMLKQGAPVRVIAPGRVYRCDDDPTHSPMFHQVEGLWVDEGISFAHLKGTLQSFINAIFGERAVRFRPSFFPFVEPGAEVDIQCVFCDGAGCKVCKGTGWMEILGAGMVHPNVLESCNIDSEKYTGFAFGLGIDRIAMLRWHIDDLKHLFRSDVRFLGQL